MNESGCRTRKANVVTELGNKKLRKVSGNNVNSHNANEPHKVTVKLVRERSSRKRRSVKREPEKHTNLLPSIIVISSKSSTNNGTNEELLNRLWKRTASANAEPSERVSLPEHGTNNSLSDLRTSKCEPTL